MSTLIQYLQGIARPYLPPEGEPVMSYEQLRNIDASLKVPGKVEVEVYPFIIAMSVVMATLKGYAAAGVGDLRECMRQSGFVDACVHTLTNEYEEPGELEL